MTTLPTDAFVPLSAGPAAANARADFRLLVVQQAEGARAFRPPPPPPARAPEPPAPQPGCKPTVSLQRDGDRVTGIHIQCSCGQVIDLACVYQA